ncbi:MAG: helix-turn-helix transcriptional regulator [Peptostreptococcaceae bacterium]
MNSDLIKQLRTEKEINQKQMAILLNMPKTTYSSKEIGTRKFTVQEAIKLCDILECDIKDIFLIKKNS